MDGSGPRRVPWLTTAVLAALSVRVLRAYAGAVVLAAVGPGGLLLALHHDLHHDLHGAALLAGLVLTGPWAGQSSTYAVTQRPSSS